jgi:hypothetical protein
MFQTVSWLQYIQTVLILLAIYYPAIILLYFRSEVIKYFTHGILLSKQKINPGNQLVNDLNNVFKNAADKKIIKEELIMMLQNKIKAYPALKEPDSKNEITKHIAFESREQCNIIFSDQELSMLWK